MKAFVYLKNKSSKLVSVINRVVGAWEDGRYLMLKTDTESMKFDTKLYKVTLYENGTNWMA